MDSRTRRTEPYTADRVQRHLDVALFVGPDLAEVNASRVVAFASGVQTKHQGFAVSIRNPVPFGLPVDTHIIFGVVASSLVGDLASRV